MSAVEVLIYFTLVLYTEVDEAVLLVKCILGLALFTSFLCGYHIVTNLTKARLVSHF